MSKRESFSLPVTCPICKKQGMVNWEENENPIHRGLERDLVAVPSGFYEGNKKDLSGDPEILCNDCNVVCIT